MAYQQAISALLGEGEESTVVMTTGDDPDEWAMWDRSRDEEAVIKDRFRDLDDPLKFLIVAAKLLTGFDAHMKASCTWTSRCGHTRCSRRSVAPTVDGRTPAPAKKDAWAHCRLRRHE